MRHSVPAREEVGQDTPLSVAAALAFPDGSMTSSALREGVRGRDCQKSDGCLIR